MITEHLHANDPGTIERAAALLKQGKLVVFPTDTLYGVGANALDEAAVGALYHAKRRPLEKGIPLLLADREHVKLVARAVPQRAQELLERFWPGPLTLIVPRRAGLPSNLSPNENVAVRIPDDDVARAIIRTAGGALATSSANLSGAPPARNAEEALQALQGAVAAVVDGGPATHGVASTIVDCTVEPPRILRQGALSPAALGLT
ncbi:MAG TPA: L-threonylcarbamoyladenylate synthase [Candidatus Binatia bacterium]|nr:L-threonylcarbamoyladenylate synthase [Candidatus Binatia bacterium]